MRAVVVRTVFRYCLPSSLIFSASASFRNFANESMARTGARRSCEMEYEKDSISWMDSRSCDVRSSTFCSRRSLSSMMLRSLSLRWWMSE